MSAIDLEDAKKHLNISVASHNEEIQATIDAAEAAISQRVGPLVAATVTATVSSRGGLTLLLPTRPVVSLTSITANGAAVADAYHSDLEAGVVTLANGAYFPSGDVDVVYQAGRATLPADLRLAVLELVRHFWKTQRNPAQFSGSSISDGPESAPGAGYLMPYRVQELIAPHEQFGFA